MHQPHDGLPQAKYPALKPRQGPPDYAPMPDPIRPQLDRPWSEDQGMNGTRGSVEGSSVMKEDSNVIKADSNAIKADSNVVKEDSNVIKEESSMEKSGQKVQVER
jgi:hypothetical protein